MERGNGGGRGRGRSLGEFLIEALETVDEKRQGWYGDLDARRHAAEEKRAQALRLTANAEREAHEFDRLRDWIRRTAGGDTGFQHAFALLPTPPPEVPITISPAVAGAAPVTPPELPSPNDAEEAAQLEVTGYVRIGEEVVEVAS